MNLPPPFWAFPWAGGQALARYVLDHSEAVRGARVLDANDIDAFALAAMALNAELNNVRVAPRGESLIEATRAGRSYSRPTSCLGESIETTDCASLLLQ